MSLDRPGVVARLAASGLTLICEALAAAGLLTLLLAVALGGLAGPWSRARWLDRHPALAESVLFSFAAFVFVAAPLVWVASTPPVAVAGDTILIGCTQNRIYAVTTTGGLRWVYAVGSDDSTVTPTTGILPGRDLVVVSTDRSLIAFPSRAAMPGRNGPPSVFAR